ncbi:electron transporter [Luteitalea sp. TBR-22]|uniref:SCO family protein n=1 Tax=Luteitalea sp. TBR-22 TaxID=2802971 RepID=UPI001AF69B1A|nr:SCO family protein [Luteitalea sp. TBR-22]BCS31555.1 electron transporter [Luteitalea sp. TBR-22]
MIRKHILSWSFLCALGLAAPGCSGGAGAPAYEASATARRYPLTGVVKGVDAGARQLSVSHEAIPGLMDAMTMSFPVKEAWAVDVARVGDRLTGTLVVDAGRSWIEGVSLSKPPAGEQATGGASSATDAGIGPAPGTPLPATPLRDQAGRVVTARDFAGRDVIVTFIYTRCPLPDFCPLMMTRLNEAAARLRKAGRRDDVQMVAISIDPTRDTPEVLAEYGRQHITGEEGDPFRRWSLLTGTPDQVRTWAQFFTLTYEKERNEIAHGLRTAVVDREGRVVGVLRGNQWTTNELMALLPAR